MPTLGEVFGWGEIPHVETCKYKCDDRDRLRETNLLLVSMNARLLDVIFDAVKDGKHADACAGAGACTCWLAKATKEVA